MATITRPSATEVADRGQAIYESKLRSQLEPGNIGKLLAIDIVTEEYEMGEDHLPTVNALYARVPNANPYLLKIGYPAVEAIGNRLRPSVS